MTSIRGFVVAGAALLASGMTATAADLYGGRGSIKDDYVPVAYTSGCPSWYFRIDGGYASYDRPNITQMNVDDFLRPNIKDAWSLGGGFGRYLTCNVRADITVDHHFNSDVYGTNGNQFSPAYGQHKFGYENTVTLANIYYDFDTRSRFTPYIGIGLGFVHNQINSGSGTVAAGGPGPGNLIRINGNDNWHAAAALMTGFSLALRERMHLDAGYRFLYLGEAKTGQVLDTNLNATAGPARVEEIHAHEFRVGLRFDFGAGGPGCCAAAAPLK